VPLRGSAAPPQVALSHTQSVRCRNSHDFAVERISGQESCRPPRELLKETPATSRIKFVHAFSNIVCHKMGKFMLAISSRSSTAPQLSPAGTPVALLTNARARRARIYFQHEDRIALNRYWTFISNDFKRQRQALGIFRIVSRNRGRQATGGSTRRIAGVHAGFSMCSMIPPMTTLVPSPARPIDFRGFLRIDRSTQVSPAHQCGLGDVSCTVFTHRQSPWAATRHSSAGPRPASRFRRPRGRFSGTSAGSVARLRNFSFVEQPAETAASSAKSIDSGAVPRLVRVAFQFQREIQRI